MQLWEKYHGRDPPGTKYDKKILEDIPDEELESLMKYVWGVRPEWGKPTPWWEVDHVGDIFE